MIQKTLKEMLDEGISSNQGNPDVQALLRKVYAEVSRDSLTGVLTRRCLDEMPEEERRINGKHGMGILMIDVDHFHEYNERFGHPQGDLALGMVGQTILSQVREGDVFRYGGEEFLGLIYGVNLDQTREIAERIRACVERADVPGNSTDKEGYEHVTVTIGVSALGLEEQSLFGQKVCDADKNLYEGKRNGRNQVYG